MKTTLTIIAIGCGIALGSASYAAAPADAPSGSTGLCNDGSYYNGATKKGACKGHKGVKDWWGAADATPSKDAKSAPMAPAAAAPAAPETKAAPAAEKKSATPKPAAVAAAGGGPGKVWVNTDSKVYHCPADRWYGKTKQGEYMSEADAVAKGYHADHGKACK